MATDSDDDPPEHAPTEREADPDHAARDRARASADRRERAGSTASADGAVAPGRIGLDDGRRDRSALAVPIWLDRVAAWAQRLIVLGILLGAVLWLALRVRVALVPFLIAFVASAALRPLARRLERAGVPHALAAALPLVGVGGVLGGAGWFVYGQTRATLEGDELTQDKLRERIESWLMGSPFDLTIEQIRDAEDSIGNWLASGVDSLGTQEATMVLQIVGGALLTLVLTFFLTKDGPMMWDAIVSRVDPVRRRAVYRSGQAVSATVSAYLRSVILTGLADAVLIGLGLWLLGVPLVLPLMILTAVAGLFPLVGAIVAGGAAALVALVAVGPATAVWVIVLTLVVQQVEGNVLAPLIVARQVSIHPVVVLVSLTAGGTVAGLAGAFLAVPIVAALISAVRTFSGDLEVVDEPPPDLASP